MIYWPSFGVLEAAELKLYSRKRKSYYMSGFLEDFFSGWLVLFARSVTLI